MDIESDIEQIKERNKRVEADKAWEKSYFRVASVSILTFVIASCVLYVIGVQNFFRNALIPTIGYFLSTQSLPILKKWWIRKYYR